MSAVYGVLTRTVLHILETSWQAAVLAAVVLLLGMLLRGRLSARWRCALWLVVLVRLLMPVVPESPMSLFNLLPIELALSGTDAQGDQAVGPLDGGLPAPAFDPRFAGGILPTEPALARGQHSQAASQLDPLATRSQWFTTETIWMLVASGWVLVASS